jgi:type I restriction-modification system DNA methylase subunit
MANGDLNWITNYIWGIADDVLRDLYVRGKYRDVILPMTVLRRLDSLLEPTKKAVLDMKTTLDKARLPTMRKIYAPRSAMAVPPRRPSKRPARSSKPSSSIRRGR